MSGLQEGFRVAPQSTLKIRQIAWNTRQALGLPEGRIDVPKLLEGLHRYGIVVDVFDQASAPVGQGIEACWVPETSTLYIHEAVYADAVRGGPRATFTITHELGHILLAHRRTINREVPGGSYPKYENSEWQANTYAAEFSMPLVIIQRLNLWSARALAHHFGVSVQAAEIRLEKLKATSAKK
ncbi:ImmA/IrrE family metallo-endopeptidase [Variovorax sp. HJSM1_2]|uniref:ImmA/IrrE family metallo-endopeptidase n=1 Tax=Variovorax sp. HJSM1_2 TaxID=3366263 RepID=UPI003BC52F8B